MERANDKKSEAQNLAIVLKPEVMREFANFLPILTSWLLKRKKTVTFLERDTKRVQNLLGEKLVKKISFISESDMYSEADLIISLGGDGTLIGICRKIKSEAPPIFGVNLGHLGFITEFNQTEVFEDLSDYFSGRLPTSNIHLFSVKVYRQDKLKFQECFLNDAVISKHHISRIFSLSVQSGDEHLYNLSGDGLIISSPLGSTAYSLAAGGPIVHPSVKAMILTPICPHGLNYRPMVIPDQEQINIRILRNTEHVTLTLDGQSVISIEKEDSIYISREKKKIVTLIKNPQRSYFQTLQEKFVNSVRKR